MKTIREFRAKLRFLRPEEGGRSQPFYSGYRPACDFGHRDEQGRTMFYSCALTLEGRDRVLPGEECYARVRPSLPEFLQDVIKVGTSFALTEVVRVVGHGTIVEVCQEAHVPEPSLVR